jgi:hypothetical protein
MTIALEGARIMVGRVTKLWPKAAQRIHKPLQMKRKAA